MRKFLLLLVLATSMVGAEGVYINDGGTLREITEIWINDASTLREIQTAWINDGGTLRQIFSNTTVTLSGRNISYDTISPNNAYARVLIDNNGLSYESKDEGSANYNQIHSTTDWVRPAAASPGTYQVRWTNAVGDALYFETAAEDTWWPMSSGDFTLTIRDTLTAGGPNAVTFDIEIRDGTGPTLSSASYSLSAWKEP